MTIKSVLVRLRGENSDLNRALAGSAAKAKLLKDSLDDGDKSARRFSDALEVSNDRTTMLVQTALALGPALVPIGAQAAPIIMGLTTQMTLAAGAAGVTALAFSGVGDSLKAVNEYAIDPSVANFDKMNEELAKIGPAGREFVMYLQELRPELQRLQDVAQEGMLPGVQEGIEELMGMMPQVEGIVSTIARTLGDIVADAGADLAGPEWREFFDYVEREAAPMLTEMAQTLGNFMQGIANMIVAFEPLNRDFSAGFLDMAESFEAWSAGLSESQGFRDFVEYIQDTGPQVWDTLGALASALVDLVVAAAPVGAVSLHILEALADTLAAIMRSPAGPILVGVAAGMSAVSRAVALYKVANGSAMLGFLTGASKDGTKAGFGLRHAAAGVGLLAAAMTDLDDKAGLASTTTGSLLGLLAGGAPGLAAGATLGFAKDLADAGAEVADKWESANDALTATELSTVKSEYRSLRDEFDRLSNIAGTDLAGNMELLSLAFRRGLDYPQEMADEIEALRRRIRELKSASGGVASLLGQGLGSELGYTADHFEDAALAADEFRRALGRVNALLEKRSNFRDYQAALDDFTKSIEDNGKSFRVTEEAGRKNQEALDNIAGTALKVAANFKGMERLEFLTRARKAFIDAATDMRIPQERAEKLATQLGLLDKIDPKVKTTEEGADKTKGKLKDVEKAAKDVPDLVTVLAQAETDSARSRLNSLAALLNSLDGKVATTYINTIRTGSQQGWSGGGPGLADGGTIDGQRYPYGDKVLAFVAPGEEIVSNRYGQADRHRELLKAINANRFADGGTIARPSSSVTNNYGMSGPLRLEGELLVNGSWTRMRAVASDVYQSERRHDRITGRS